MPLPGSRGVGTGPDSHIRNFEAQQLQRLLDVGAGHITGTFELFGMGDEGSEPVADWATRSSFIYLGPTSRDQELKYVALGASAVTTPGIVTVKLYSMDTEKRELVAIQGGEAPVNVTAAGQIVHTLKESVSIPQHTHLWVGLVADGTVAANLRTHNADIAVGSPFDYMFRVGPQGLSRTIPAEELVTSTTSTDDAIIVTLFSAPYAAFVGVT